MRSLAQNSRGEPYKSPSASPDPDHPHGGHVTAWIIAILLAVAIIIGGLMLFSGPSDILDQRLAQLQSQVDELEQKVQDGILSETDRAALDTISQTAEQLEENGQDLPDFQQKLTALNQQINKLKNQTGQAGSTGAEGPTGTQGPKGNQGSKGAKGDKGEPGQDGCLAGSCVSLQDTTPGTAETGHINLTGTIIAGSFSGDGANLTGVDAAYLSGFDAGYFTNADNISSGELSDDRLSSNVMLKDQANILSDTLQLTAAGTALTVTNTASIGTLAVTGNSTFTGTITTTASLTFGTSISSTCEGISGYVWVPGNPKFGTMPGFCVMQYEAKDVGGVATSQADSTPWATVSQRIAQDRSREACDGCHLITEPEWMTIATDVLWIDANWSGGTVGSGCLFRGNVGNTDNCGYNGSDPEFGAGRNAKAKLTLSNGGELWDISGNVWEWTDAWVQGKEQPNDAVDGFAWHQYNAITDFKGLQYLNPTNRNWTSTQGIGQIHSDGTAANNAQYAFRRGGHRNDTTNAGVFSLNLSTTPSDTASGQLGFRVSR